MKPIEVITKSEFKACNKCKGNGCHQCSEGIYINESFILVTKTKSGQKIAFNSDHAGK